MKRYPHHRQRLMLRELSTIVDRIARGEVPAKNLEFDELTNWLPMSSRIICANSKEVRRCVRLFEKGYRIAESNPERWIPRSNKSHDFLPTHQVFSLNGKSISTDNDENPAPILKAMVEEGIITINFHRKINRSLLEGGLDSAINYHIALFTLSEEERAFQAFQTRPELAPYLP